MPVVARADAEGFLAGSNGGDNVVYAHRGGQGPGNEAVAMQREHSLAGGAEHSAALTRTGLLLCWGGGDDTGEQLRAVPRLGPYETFISVAAGGMHTAALTSSGKLVCWGTDDNKLVSNVPVLDCGESYIAFSVGAAHALALTSAGRVLAWGSDELGQVSGISKALTLELGERVVALAAGGCHSVAVTSAGRAVCWGDDSSRQTSGVKAPASGERYVSVAAGYAHTAAVTSAGELVCWGANEDGQHGPPALTDDERVTAVAAGVMHTVVLTNTGRVLCMGGEESVARVPVLEPHEHFVSIAAGAHHSLALTSAGRLLSWGAEDARPAQAVPQLGSDEGWALSGDVEAPMAKAVDMVLDLARRGGCVPWRRGRLVVFGAAGHGKTTTIRALRGEPADPNEPSTVGTATQVVELERQQVELAGRQPLRTKEPEELQDSVADALAAEAKFLVLGRDSGSLSHMSSRTLLDELKDNSPASSFAASAAAGTPTPTPTGSRATTATTGRSAGYPEAAMPRLPPTARTTTGRPGAGASPQPSAASASAAAAQPQVDRSRAMRHARSGSRDPGLSISIFDCGGQDQFRDMHDIFQWGRCVFLVIVSLPKLLDESEADGAVEEVRRQLDAIAAHCSEPRALLACTSAGADGPEQQAQTKLAGALLMKKLRGTSPLFDKLIRNKAYQQRQDRYAWLFPVENAIPFEENDRLKDLLVAIEDAVGSLQDANLRVPVRWLQVHSKLQELSEVVGLDKVEALARDEGLPHEGIELEVEVRSMLELMHNLGCLFWLNTSALQNIVVLQPQWILDGFARVIRDYARTDHKRPNDQEAMDQHPDEWMALTKGDGLLNRCLLPYLWSDPRFVSRQQELLGLMLKFGLAVELRGKQDLMVPSLMSSGSTLPQDNEAPHFFLHFSLNSKDELIWHSKDWERGFMPMGVFHHVAAACVAWTYFTIQGDVHPTVNGSQARVHFGTETLLLSVEPSQPLLRVELQREASERETSAAAAAERVLLLVEDVLRRHYQHLKVRMLLPINGVRVDREELLKSEGSGQIICAGNAGEFCSVGDVANKLRKWVELKGTRHFYHVYFSHRPGETDSACVATTTVCLQASCLRTRQPVTVFQEARSTMTGDLRHQVVMKAQSTSLVIVPVISWAALANMEQLQAGSPCDELLVEWTLALWLHEHLGARILPVKIGSSSRDEELRAFGAGRDGALAGEPSAALPDVVVQAAVDRLRDFAARQGQALPDKFSSAAYSVRGVVAKLLQFGGIEFADVKARSGAWGVYEELSKEIRDVVEQQVRSAEGLQMMHGRQATQTALELLAEDVRHINITWPTISSSSPSYLDALKSPAIRNLCPQVNTIVQKVATCVQTTLPTRPGAASLLPLFTDVSELHAIVAYTFDLGGATSDGNVYKELNKMLRDRSGIGRLNVEQTWGLCISYTMTALSRLPNYQGICYRGFKHTEIPKVQQEYTHLRDICWGAFSSTTTSLLTAAGDFAMQGGAPGVVFQIKVTTGKDIGELSYMPTEAEVLLTPNMHFAVTRAPRRVGIAFSDTSAQIVAAGPGTRDFLFVELEEKNSAPVLWS